MTWAWMPYLILPGLFFWEQQSQAPWNCPEGLNQNNTPPGLRKTELQFYFQQTGSEMRMILKQAGFYGKKIVNSYEKIKNNIMKKNNNENKNNKDDELKNNPPNLNEDNFPETKRPLQEDNNNQKENENNQEQKNPRRISKRD